MVVVVGWGGGPTAERDGGVLRSRWDDGWESEGLVRMYSMHGM